MNAVDARSRETPHGYLGEFRKVHRAEWEAVCVDGKVKFYPSAEAAEIAAWRALKAHLCADIVGSGERVSAAKSNAESLFGAIFKRGKKIVVERK